MKNPFDPERDSMRHGIFRDITQAIDAWMLDKYPKFDTELEGKIDTLITLQKQAEDTLNYSKKHINDQKKDFLDYVKKEINCFLDEKYPGMSQRYSQIVLEMERSMKKIKSHEDKIDELCKKLNRSNSMYEDMYKIRDDMIGFRKVFEELKHKMKVLFK